MPIEEKTKYSGIPVLPLSRSEQERLTKQDSGQQKPNAYFVKKELFDFSEDLIALVRARFERKYEKAQDAIRSVFYSSLIAR